MKQRDNEWRQARLGDVTASRFADVLTNASTKGVFDVEGQRGEWYVTQSAPTGGFRVSGDFDTKAKASERKSELSHEWQKKHFSTTAESYLNEKLAELIHCQPSDTWRSDATDWGTENEPHAFEAAISVVERIFGESLSLPEGDFAYIQHATEPGIGCSPDGIIGKDGLGEIKCPYNGAKWIAMKRLEREYAKHPDSTLRDCELPAADLLGREYVPQVQGQMWASGRKWSVFFYFDPRVKASGVDPLLWARVERDDTHIDSVLAPRVLEFRDYLRAEYENLIGKAPF